MKRVRFNDVVEVKYFDKTNVRNTLKLKILDFYYYLYLCFHIITAYFV